MNSSRLAAPALAAAVALVLACSSGDAGAPASTPGASVATSTPRTPDPTPSPAAPPATPAASPSPSPDHTPTPVPTASPPLASPTATPTPAPAVALPEVNLATLGIPVCRTDPTAGGQVGFGTVPRNPNFNGGNGASGGDPQAGEPEVVLALAPLVAWLEPAVHAADTAWSAAVSEQDFARALAAEGRRTWIACNAVAAMPEAARAHAIGASLAGSLQERRTWLAGRLEALREDPASIRADDPGRAATSMSLAGMQALVEDLARTLGEPGLVSPSGFTVNNPLLEASLQAPAGWFVARNDVDMQLSAPWSAQAEGVLGLGVPGWNAGTAVRVRRLRHEPPWTLDDTRALLDSLYLNFGEPGSDRAVTMAGSDGVVRTYESARWDWTSFVAAAVIGDRSYLIELGCPAPGAGECEDALRDFAAGLQVSTGG